ncbi:uncharacterized protein LOC134861183 [Eleginops maclovinus]|uniref:uncharacterized protein LOC134861183 n=1 Tax=Eleginops maclovinus TaxID=56733 RepID=UPI00308019B3
MQQMGVPYMKIFRKHLQDLHLYFRNSANRTSALKAAASVLGVEDLKVTEVKDTRWLSQEKAISNLQRNLPAVLATLAEEAELKKDPVARGLYTYCATYRFVAAVHLQSDILPYLAQLSKLFQKEDINFMAIKNHVPVTIETLRIIKAAGERQPEGSFLAQVEEKVANLNISAEEDRVRRGTALPTDTLWARFQTQVMEPYIDGLIEHLELRFQQLGILGAFSSLGPQGPQADESRAISDLQLLAKQFPPISEMALLQEWQSYKVLITTGILKDKSQLEIMTAMASGYDELHLLYPNLSLLSAIALTIPVSSVNCERDFSAMNRHCPKHVVAPWYVDFGLNWDQVSSAIRLRVEKEERPLQDQRKAFVVVLVDQMMQHDRNPSRAMCHSVVRNVVRCMRWGPADLPEGETEATLENRKRDLLNIYSGDMMKPSGWLISIEGHVVMGPHPLFLHRVAAFFSSYYVFNLEYPAAGSSTLESIQRMFETERSA